MKKIISILCCGILALGLISCGEKKEDSSVASGKLDEIREEQKNNECNIVLADTENVTITCKGKGKSAFGGIYITLEIINKTDKDILVGIDKCSNDGVMVDALFGETITANAKSESDLSVMDESLTEVKNFKGIFNVRNDSNGDMIEGNIEFSIE